MDPEAVSLKYLREHCLFGGITDDKIKAILPLMEEVSFAAGSDILSQGEFGDRIYFILKGSVEVLKDHGDGTLQRLDIIPEGETIGEMEVLEPERGAATIRALEPIQALSLSNACLYHVFREDPATFTLIILNLARLIVRRMRKLQERVIG
ncbi:MAG TPA: cyclic nucleotide-binding domain-containing protein [bacterium]|mgnify:CR=1 FL=1|nr:cyclic nucleotide-binding domain-containing protein [bacterium]HPQ66042.1 cyclic nucleotide-binding domain-containing protein [bacterium]